MRKFTLAMALATTALAAQAMEDKVAYDAFKKDGETYVFSDFQSADYVIRYDAVTKKATYRASIKLEIAQAGHAIFDVVVAPKKVTLDGAEVSAPEVSSPGNEATFRAVSVSAAAGNHELVVEGEITRLVEFQGEAVRSAYWLNDLYDRSFMENYLPSSFEYDRVKMNFDVEIANSSRKHAIITNAVVEERGLNSFSISYPAYYNTASIFFHMLPADRLHAKRFTLESVDGRKLPGITYYPLAEGASPSADAEEILTTAKEYTENSFHRLEQLFGPFLHDTVTVYATTGGGFPGIAGMEYCGATMTDLPSINHEITHSYFGRGIIPANGNSGWIDEAITTWGSDEDFRPYDWGQILDPKVMFTMKPYTRFTNRRAYSQGADFMGRVGGYLKKSGQQPFNEFLKHLIEDKAFRPYTSEDFFTWSKDFYGKSFLEMIGQTAGEDKAHKGRPAAHHEHRRFTNEELAKLL